MGTTTASRSVTVNFASVYDRVEMDYNAPLLDVLSPEQKEQVKQYTDTLASFTEEELLFLRWRMMWRSKARVKQLPPKEFDNFVKQIWMVRSGRGWGKTLVGSNWLGMEAAAFASQYYDERRRTVCLFRGTYWFVLGDTTTTDSRQEFSVTVNYPVERERDPWVRRGYTGKAKRPAVGRRLAGRDRVLVVPARSLGQHHVRPTVRTAPPVTRYRNP
jgi:hypothetical protein